VGVAFKGGNSAEPTPESPEALYRDLPRRPGASPGLWLHQGDVLRSYADKHTETADLALELPTGTGMTMAPATRPTATTGTSGAPHAKCWAAPSKFRWSAPELDGPVGSLTHACAPRCA
jgi:hypothetical protein